MQLYNKNLLFSQNKYFRIFPNQLQNSWKRPNNLYSKNFETKSFVTVSQKNFSKTQKNFTNFFGNRCLSFFNEQNKKYNLMTRSTSKFLITPTSLILSRNLRLTGKSSRFSRIYFLKKPLLLIGGGLLTLYFFGGAFVTIVKWIIYLSLGLFGLNLIFRKFRRFLLKDFIDESLILLQKHQKEIEKIIECKFEIPSSTRKIKLQVDHDFQTTVGPRSAFAYNIPVEGPKGCCFVVVIGTQGKTATETNTVREIFVEFLEMEPTKSGMGIKQNRSYVYLNHEKTTIIDGETSRIFQTEVIPVVNEKFTGEKFKEVEIKEPKSKEKVKEAEYREVKKTE